MERDYHFSLQFTADLVSMNKSDFIITSTYQEIAGTETDIGQYESYQFFTMPGLYRVVNGVNLFNPKFNVVPPGVDESIYFPFYEQNHRIPAKIEYWQQRLFSAQLPDIRGWLRDIEKIPIFTMSRLDHVKNITGLIKAFANSTILRQHCNLIFAGGATIIGKSHDREEQAQIQQIYKLFDQYKLEGGVRWLPSIPKQDTGVVYRIIADCGGVFVQPALFEGFGLTIIEAMLSGLPTFGPKFGGPSEIIEPGKNGFLMNTSKPELIAAALEDFIQTCAQDPEHWKNISENGIQRVREHFTWEKYSRKLISLTKLYGFWRYSVANQGMIKIDRYCDLLYHMIFNHPALGADAYRCQTAND